MYRHDKLLVFTYLTNNVLTLSPVSQFLINYDSKATGIDADPMWKCGIEVRQSGGIFFIWDGFDLTLHLVSSFWQCDLEIEALLFCVTSSLDAVGGRWERELEPLRQELEELWLLFDRIIESNPEYNLKRCMERVRTL